MYEGRETALCSIMWQCSIVRRCRVCGSRLGAVGDELGSGQRLEGGGERDQGATVTPTDDTQWQFNSAGGQTHETINVANGVLLHPSDWQWP